MRADDVEQIAVVILAKCAEPGARQHPGFVDVRGSAARPGAAIGPAVSDVVFTDDGDDRVCGDHRAELVERGGLACVEVAELAKTGVEAENVRKSKLVMRSPVSTPATVRPFPRLFFWGYVA